MLLMHARWRDANGLTILCRHLLRGKADLLYGFTVLLEIGVVRCIHLAWRKQPGYAFNSNRIFTFARVVYCQKHI